MKAYLMHRDRDFDLDAELPWNTDDLMRDLELETLLQAMAIPVAVQDHTDGRYLYDIAKRALLSSLTNPEEIRYRQDILDDALREPDVIRDLYILAVEAIKGERKVWLGGFSQSPELILHRAVEVLDMFVGMLRRLRSIAEEHGPRFRSDGFVRLFEMVVKELGDEYLATVEEHLRQLRFRGGALISARLGPGLKGRAYVLRKPIKKDSWLHRMTTGGREGYTYHLPERDESGARALATLKNRGINGVAGALAQSNDHILSFFRLLRAELAFYVGCLNLHDRLAAKQEPTCLPDVLPAGRPMLGFRGLYDPSLSLNLGQTRAVGNTLNADDVCLLVITGANQGGKSTFLRSLGLAQLMLQAGMFVAAESLHGTVADGLFTHFKREEDVTMSSGKLDEELARMSQLADHLRPSSMVLFNESFAATNEREGSQIGREIVHALREIGVTVVIVTHLYDLAHSLHAQHLPETLFLRPQRHANGRRTFQLYPGEPEATSYGTDLYRRIFDEDPQSAPAIE